MYIAGNPFITSTFKFMMQVDSAFLHCKLCNLSSFYMTRLSRVRLSGTEQHGQISFLKFVGMAHYAPNSVDTVLGQFGMFNAI